MYEREPTLVTNTKLLIEHLQAEGVGMNGHLLLLLISVPGIVDFKDDDLHLDSHAQVDVTTELPAGEKRGTCERVCVCVRVCVYVCVLVHVCGGGM